MAGSFAQRWSAARRETISSFYSSVRQDQENRLSPLPREANGRPRSGPQLLYRIGRCRYQ
jgi:hypothetical protein